MQFAAEFREPVAGVGEDFLRRAVEAFVEEVEILVEGLQLSLGRMTGELGGEQLELLAQARLPAGDEFGRASCRERVCQYV